MNKALITVDNQSKTSSVVDYKEFSCPPNDNSNSTEDYMFNSIIFQSSSLNNINVNEERLFDSIDQAGGGLRGRNCGGGGLEESQLKGKI